MINSVRSILTARKARRTNRPRPVKIGLLYSLTGGLSVTEASVHSGALLEIEQINAREAHDAGRQGRPDLVPRDTAPA